MSRLRGSSVILCALSISLLLLAGPVRAADTTEPFDLGFSDVDFYLSGEGFGLEEDERSHGAELMLGYGLASRLSGHLGVAMNSDSHLLSASTELSFGLYGTVLDGENFDLDLFLAFGASGEGLDEVSVSPAFELNWDAEPELDFWGLYTRGGMTMTGHEGDSGPERYGEYDLTLGCYWTLRPGQQLLLEYDGASIEAESGDREWIGGALTLGYNRSMNETMEMISSLVFDIGDDEQDGGMSFTLGFIATLPAGT